MRTKIYFTVLRFWVFSVGMAVAKPVYPCLLVTVARAARLLRGCARERNVAEQDATRHVRRGRDVVAQLYKFH